MVEKYISPIVKRKIRMAAVFNKWLRSKGSTLYYDPLLKAKYYEKYIPPKVNIASFKVRPELKEKLKKWSEEDRVTMAVYLRRVLALWEKHKDKKEKAVRTAIKVQRCG